MNGQRKKLVGFVVSDKMDKTVVVRVETLKRHHLYHKVLKHARKYKAHDAQNKCRVGDQVLIVESRPISKEKSWVVEAILEKTEGEPALTSLAI
jgi:small subunit ribosomal protein S17